MAQSPSSVADPRFVALARQPGLDLLRAVAILLVLFYHAGLFGFSLPGRIQRFGWIGVDLFFVLSGYLIAGQLLKSLAGGEQPSVRRFFWRRALRILPAYLVVVAIYFILPALREYPTIPPLWKFLTFTQNLGLHGGTAFSHAWSLCVEAQFYLVLPFVLLALRKVGRGAVAIACAVIIGGIVLRATIAYSIAIDGAVPFRGFQRLIYYATWTRLDPLTLGVALAAIARFRAGWWALLMRNAPWLGVVGLGLIGYALYLGETEQLTITAAVWQFPLLASGLAMLLLCAVSPRLPFSRVAIPGVGFIASIAYSVYLSHKLVIHALSDWCTARAISTTSPLAIGLMAVATVTAGVALFFAIERPFLQYRQRSGTVPN
ncbi:MAG: acyltransferase [Verrucomicrobiota bacterium]|nr:acyltransferase [Verrucomicrobiota bacterium]